MNNRRYTAAALWLLGVACAKPGGGLLVTPTICSLTKTADALVQCQFTGLGPQETVEQAGLQPGRGSQATAFDVNSGESVRQLTLDTSGAVKGSLSGTVVAFTGPWDVSVSSYNVASPQYTDGTFASGYCFLRQNSGQWVLGGSGFFRRDEAAPSILRNSNMYTSGIDEQNFLGEVATSNALSGSCPAPALPPPLNPSSAVPGSGVSPQDGGLGDGGFGK